MKLLIVMPLAEQRGGSELMLLNLLQHGQGAGIGWTVVFLKDGPMIAQARALGAAVHLVLAGRIREVYRFAAVVWRIADIARQMGADAIFSWVSTSHLYGGPAAALAGVPALWYQLGMPSDSWIDRLATVLPNRGILACSESGARAQARLKPLRPLRVVYPGVDLRAFDPTALPPPAEARRRLGLPTVGPLVGIVGRLQRWKGIHTLIEAMPAILAVRPDAHCVIVGGEHALEPDYGGYLRTRLAALQLQEQVTLAGLQRNVPEWMQAMDVVVHASNNEPFGIVVIEAMALAKPVVASDRGGPTEIITPGQDGLLAPYDDAATLAAAVGCYLQDVPFAHRLGQAARRRALAFATESYAQNFIASVRSLLSA